MHRKSIYCCLHSSGFTFPDPAGAPPRPFGGPRRLGTGSGSESESYKGAGKSVLNIVDSQRATHIKVLKPSLIFIVVIEIIKVIIVIVLKDFVFKGFAGEVVNCARDHLRMRGNGVSKTLNTGG